MLGKEPITDLGLEYKIFDFFQRQKMKVQQVKYKGDGFDSDSDEEFEKSARQYYAYKNNKEKYQVFGIHVGSKNGCGICTDSLA